MGINQEPIEKVATFRLDASMWPRKRVKDSHFGPLAVRIITSKSRVIAFGGLDQHPDRQPNEIRWPCLAVVALV